MPATYAHMYFGRRVFERMKDSDRATAESSRVLFDTGLSGPDILFFYKPYKKTEIRDLGSRMHFSSSLPFFEETAERIRQSSDQEAAKAYVYGFICHFALDSSCHHFVTESMEATGLSHSRIETEFDKSLMKEDGADPFACDVTAAMGDGTEGTDTEGLILGIKPEEAGAAIRSMRRFCRLFRVKNKALRAIMFFLLKPLGIYGTHRGLYVDDLEWPECRESTEGLRKRMEGAVDLALELIDSYNGYFENGTPLDTRFDRDFES